MTFKHAIAAPARGVKSLQRMVFNRSAGWSRWMIPRRDLDYQRAVGDGLRSSVVVAPIMWMARTFPEAPIQVLDEDGAPVPGHPMVAILRRPNPFYSGLVMWMATIASWALTGDAYWLKIRNGAGQVVELWWTPSVLIEPFPDPDGKAFIKHYIYRPGDGPEIEIANDDLVHFRYGLDPDNPRRGWSPLKSVLREVFTDDEAAIFTAALLHNMGIPGVIVSPKKGEQPPSPDDVAAVKDYVDDEFTGDRRGKPLVFSGPTDVQQFGFDPRALDLRQLRRIPEERLSGVLGIPAILCGFGAGLERSTFANYEEARAAGHEDCIIPTQRIFGEDLWHQLLPDFDTAAALRAVGWDRSQVRVLQEDRTKEAERAATLVGAGIWTRKAALNALGEEADDLLDDVYLLKLSTVVTPASELPATDPEPEPDDEPVEDPPDPDDDEPDDQDDDAADAPPDGKRRRRRRVASRGRAERHKALSDEQRDGLARMLAKDVDQLTGVFTRELQPALAQLGDLAADAYLAEHAAHDVAAELEGAKGSHPDGVKIGLVDAIMQRLQLGRWRVANLRSRLETHYQRVGRRSVKTINDALDLDLTVTDHTLAALADTGVQRATLLDLETDTRDSVMRAISEGTDAGDNPTEVAKRIREQVPAGRFVNAGAKYRADLICRTETLNAQRLAALHAYDDSDVVTGAQAIDGDDDEDCAERNGKTFTIADALVETTKEHPNGTLTWVPVVGDLPTA